MYAFFTAQLSHYLISWKLWQKLARKNCHNVKDELLPLLILLFSSLLVHVYFDFLCARPRWYAFWHCRFMKVATIEIGCVWSLEWTLFVLEKNIYASQKLKGEADSCILAFSKFNLWCICEYNYRINLEEMKTFTQRHTWFTSFSVHFESSLYLAASIVFYFFNQFKVPATTILI